MQTAAVTYTANGAISHLETGQPMLDFYYRILRQTSKRQVWNLLEESWNFNPTGTFRLIFQLRDCRGGKGERQAFYWCLEWLIWNDCQDWVLLNLKNIPEFGSWKDLRFLMTDEMPESIKQAVYEFWANTLESDLKKVSYGISQNISLAAKWFPKEGRSFDKKYHSAKRLAKHMEISTKLLRKQVLVPLNRHLQTVETYMCAQNWNIIHYSGVPSVAMHKLKKAFERHDKERFDEFLVTDKTRKINSSQLFPHQLVKGYCRLDPVIEAQWSSLVKKSTALGNCVTMVDTSSSMCCENRCSRVLPIDVALSLGLLAATVTKAPFNNLVLTFTSEASFHDIQGKTLLDRLESIRKTPWGMNTDFQNAFQTILDRAVEFNVSAEDMPGRVLVVSDMQFDVAGKGKKTNFQKVRKMYREAGYDAPTLIFWNVNGSTSDVPVQQSEQGAILVSGFSPSVLKYLVSEDDFGPSTVLHRILKDKRYDSLVVPEFFQQSSKEKLD